MIARCVVCEKEFEKKRALQKTCSEACRKKHRNEYKRLRNKERYLNQKYQDYIKDYRRQPENMERKRANNRRRHQTPEYREWRRLYWANNPEYRESRREYMLHYKRDMRAAKALRIPLLIYTAMKAIEAFKQSQDSGCER